jgi:predicted nucleic acid-binding protein
LLAGLCLRREHRLCGDSHSIQGRSTYEYEDMLIAAIALANACVLVTRNVSNFDFLPGLEAVNPWG